MKPLWQLFLRSCAPERGKVALLLLLALAAVGLEAVMPWPLKILVDHVLPGQPLPAALRGWLSLQAGGAAALAWVVASMLALFLLHHVLQLVRNVFQAQLAARMQMRLAGDVLAQLEALSPLFHARARKGDLVRRVTADTDSVPTLLTGVLIPLLASVAGLAVLFSIMWRLDAQLALVAGFVALPMVVLMKVFGGRMAQRAYEHQSRQGELWAVSEQALSALPVVQAFGGELHEENRFRGVADRTLRAYLRTIATQLQFRFGVDGCEARGPALVLVVGGLKVLGGTLTVGTLVVFLSYMAALYTPLLGLAYLSSTLAGAAGGARRVLEVLQCEERVQDRPGAPAFRPIGAGRGGHIRFEGVHFGYRPGAPVLRDVSFVLRPGEVVALVGASGAGKSTLAAMIPRLVDPDRGRILIDGQDLRDVSLASLRRHVALVLQDPFLLPLTIAQNIRLGRPDASDRQLADAARMAHAAEFIERMPLRADTVIGERGVTLSGGQRQRLAIARALVREAPILVLDEPSSALDPASERLVMDAIDALMRGRTTLVIAHRLSTLARADRILVLEDGRIAESGTQQQLLAAGGLFYRLWLQQVMAGRPHETTQPMLAQPS
jgi:ATP-binding cassette subfamily B protein/subfamily B ATP-binding cassette protein MsbA